MPETSFAVGISKTFTLSAKHSCVLAIDTHVNQLYVSKYVSKLAGT